jgi:hypothetical protein
MSYLLLWIESLTVSLLFVATIVACLSQLGPRQARWAARGFALLVVCGGALAAVGLAANMGQAMGGALSLLCIAAIILATAAIAWVLLRRAWLATAAILTAMAPLAVYATVTVLAGFLVWRHRLNGDTSAALAALTAAFALGAGCMLVYGLRRQAELTQVRAAGWPRGPVAVALLTAAALHLMTFWNLDLAARQQLSALRTEAGTVALSVAPPRLPDRDNAAIVYQQAFEGMGRNEAAPGGWQWEKPWQEAWDKRWTTWHGSEKIGFDLHDPELRRFLKRQSSALALLREAAAKPGCNFDRDYGRPTIAMPLPELGPLRDAARLLALDALCKATDKDHREALQDVNAMFRMAGHIGSDPIMVCELVAISVDGLACDTLRHVLASGRIPPGDLSVIQFPDGVSYRTLLRRAVRMDEAFRLMTFSQVGEGQIGIRELTALDGNQPPREPPMFAALYRVFLLGDDLAAEARHTAEFAKIVGLPYPQAKDRMQQFQRDLAAHPGGILTGLLFPALVLVVEPTTRAEAKRDVARLGLALYAYRASKGRFPDKLDDLAPDFISAVPRDPFDGQAMKLKRSGEGLTVYSIGPDMIDNGGAPFDPKTKTGDITFAVQ